MRPSAAPESDHGGGAPARDRGAARPSGALTQVPSTAPNPQIPPRAPRYISPGFSICTYFSRRASCCTCVPLSSLFERERESAPWPAWPACALPISPRRGPRARAACARARTPHTCMCAHNTESVHSERRERSREASSLLPLDACTHSLKSIRANYGRSRGSGRYDFRLRSPSLPIAAISEAVRSNSASARLSRWCAALFERTTSPAF